MSIPQFAIEDNRNKRQIGPMTKAAAQIGASDLNDFVKRNAGLTQKPFFVRELTAAQAEKLYNR